MSAHHCQLQVIVTTFQLRSLPCTHDQMVAMLLVQCSTLLRHFCELCTGHEHGLPLTKLVQVLLLLGPIWCEVCLLMPSAYASQDFLAKFV